MNKLDGNWEQRWHPLREEWVVVAAHRGNRPWSGNVVEPSEERIPRHDPECALCPNVERVSGIRNEDYDGVFVFDNDHPCVGPLAPLEVSQPPAPYRVRPASGLSRVVCYSPHHDSSLSRMQPQQVSALIRCWMKQFSELSARPEVNHVLIFENRGKIVGTSNPHPHCQIYATNFAFKTIENESRTCEAYLVEQRRGLFSEIIANEQSDGRRILLENESAISFVPYFARFPYEVYVAPKREMQNVAGLRNDEVDCFASCLLDVVIRFDNLWSSPFPYVLVLHQAPVDRTYDGFHFHIELHPPLRSPGLLKYLSGPEIGGGNFLNSSSPEEKAAELKSQSTIHYLA